MSESTVAREYTINLHKRLYGVTFKNRAPAAVKQIRVFAQGVMGTRDVRLDNKLNRFVWSQGIKNVPHRIRVVLTKKRNEDENATEKFYTVASLVIVKNFKGLQTTKVAEN